MRTASDVWEKLKATDLGQEQDNEWRHYCKTVYGGVAWPGKRQGFAVVLAMSHDRHFESYDTYLIEEFESWDTRELVRRCAELGYRYSTKLWIGDTSNDAADHFMHELNEELRLPQKSNMHRPSFSITPAMMFRMENIYAYILPQIKRLLNEDSRQLFLRDSKIVNYLREIEPGTIAELDKGEYPAIEALAGVVIEARRLEEINDRIPHCVEREEYNVFDHALGRGEWDPMEFGSRRRRIRNG